ncbi:hypothetical protein GCM10010522_73410 [Kribbella solani]
MTAGTALTAGTAWTGAAATTLTSIPGVRLGKIRLARHDARSGLNPIQLGHPDIHHNHVRPQPPYRLNRRQPITGLTNHGQIRLRVNHHPKPGPHHLLVLNQQHPRHAAIMTPRPPQTNPATPPTPQPPEQ